MQQGQRGAMTIVEATLVFPIMFIIVFIMLMACEGYYQYARVERACIAAAVRGAARCENPMLEVVQKTGEVPTSTTAAKVRPYRYIFTSDAKEIARQMQSELEETIAGFDVVAFRGMTPDNVDVKIEPKMNILVSSFPVQCSFDITLPIRLILPLETVTFHYEIAVTEPIGDPAEFVRNVSTVQDYVQRSGKIMEYVEKIQSAMDKIARFIN